MGVRFYRTVALFRYVGYSPWWAHSRCARTRGTLFARTRVRNYTRVGSVRRLGNVSALVFDDDNDDEMWKCPSAIHCRETWFPYAVAARRGHFNCLKRLREDDEAECDVLAPRSTAREGHLECLRYLHESGCPWDAGACEDAARHGRLECLRYLHENGCPWDWWAYRAVASGGHTGCQEYLRKHGCPMGDDDNDNNAVRAACFDNDEEERCLFASARTVIEAKAPPSSIE